MAWYGQGRGTLAIVLTAPVIVTSSLPNATQNSTYSTNLSAVSGTPPYTFTLLSGADGNGFPACSSSGVLSGTPASVETLNLVFQVTDSLGTPSSPTSLTLSVNAQTGTPSFYIGPNAPITNVGAVGGTMVNPWNIAAINDPTSRTMYAGKIVGILPGTYNVNSQINSLGGSAGVAPYYNIEGGTPSSPTTILATTARAAILNGFANNDGVTYPTTGAFMIGQAISAVLGQSQINNPGNVVIDSIACTGGNGGFISFAMDNGANAPGTQIPGHVVQNCETFSTTGDAGGNLGHIKFRNCLNNVARNNLCHGTYASSGTAANSSVLFGFTNVGGLYEYNTLYDSPTLIHDKNYQLNNPTYRYNYLELNNSGGLSPPTGAFEDCTGGAQGTTVQLYNNVIYCNTGGKFYDGDDAQTGNPPPPFPYPATSAVCSVNMYNNTCYINGGTVGVFMQCLGNAVAGGVTISPPASLSHWNNIWYLTGSFPTGGAGANGAFGQCQGTFCQGVQDYEIIYCANPNTGNVAQTRVATGFSSSNPITGWTMAQWRAAGPWHANSQILTTPAANTVFTGVASLTPTGFQLVNGTTAKGFGRVGGVSSGAIVDSGAWGGASPPARIGCNFSSVFTIPVITTSSLPNATVGVAYSQGLSVTGGSPPYSFRRVSAVPNTLLAWTVSSSGAVQATPQAAETTAIKVQAVDSVGSVSAPVTLNVTSVASGTLALVTASLPAATNGGMYAVQCIAQGGQPPYFWTSSWTTSPYMDRSGLLHGVLTTAPATGTITVTDSAGSAVTSASLSIAVNSTLAIAQQDNVDGFLRLPDAYAATLYGTPAIQAFGGTGPYTYALTSGALPSGLSLASNGQITGTVSANAGTSSGVITATDSASHNATASFLMNVRPVAQATRPAYNTGTGFFILNGNLYDPGGNLFIPRGWNRDHYDQAPTGMQLTSPSACKDGTGVTNGTVAVSTYANDMLNNLIANNNLPIYPIFQNPINNAVTSGDSSTVNLAACVGYWCSNLSAYTSTVGQNWIPGVANEWGPAGKTASTAWLNAHLPVIANISNISGTTITVSTVSATNPFASCPFAWIQGAGGITNQMVSLSAPSGTSGAWTVTSSVSLTGYTSGGVLGGGSIGAMRAAGWTTCIKVDAGNFGQNPADLLTFAAQIQAADPQQNVLFDLHLYNYYTPANCVVGSVSTGATTVLHLNSSLPTHPFTNQNNGNFFPEVSITVQGASGTGWTAMNGTWTASSFSAATGGSYTVTIAFNSSGLTAGNYSASSARAYDSYNPTIMSQTFAALRSSNVCMMYGEFGTFNCPSEPSCMTHFDVIQGAEANGIGWQVWAWDDNTGSGITGFPMIQGTPPPHYTSPASLSPSGQGPVMHPRMSCNVLATSAPVYLP